MSFSQSVATSYLNNLQLYKDKANNGTITSAEVSAAKNLAAVYYTYLSENNIAYGNAALTVVRNDGGFGTYANNLLNSELKELHPTWTDTQISDVNARVLINLAFEDCYLRANTADGIISYSAIADYHYDIYAINGLPKTSWGGTFFEEFVGSGSYTDLGINYFDDVSTVNFRSAFKDVVLNQTRNGINAANAFQEMWSVSRAGNSFLDEAGNQIGNLLLAIKQSADAFVDWASSTSLSSAVDAIGQAIQNIFTSDGQAAPPRYVATIGITLPATGQTSVGIVHEYGSVVVSSGNLSTQDKAATIAHITHQVKTGGLGPDSAITTATFVDATNNSMSTATVYSGDVNKVLSSLGGISTNGVTIGTAGTNGETLISLISDTATTVVNGVSYALSDVMHSFQSAAVAVTDFITHEIENGMKWFTDTNGAQTTIAEWLGNNIVNLADGTLSASDAFIGLAKFMSQRFLASEISGTITHSQASTIMSNVFQRLGVDAVSAGEISGLVAISLERMAVDFAFHINDWNGEQYRNAAITTVSAVVAQHYASQYLGDAASVPMVAAVVTLVSGLLNSDGYDQGDWIMLGIQTYLAANAALAGYIANIYLPGSGPIVSALAAYVQSKILSFLYQGKVFHAGEFGDPSLVINSIYTIQQIDDGTGHMVNALIATSTNGSTILAKGITHIIGAAGEDVLVDHAGVDSYILGNGGSDYLEGRAGDDALIGGDGNDILNGGDGKDILQGDGGDDTIFGEDGDDIVIAGTGNDFVHLGSGDDIANGGAGDDYILAGMGDDAVAGEEGNDTLDGGEGDDSMEGGAGDDLILGNLGNDSITGGDGADIVFGTDGNDTIYGGDGNDFIAGGKDIDILHGDNGNDLIVGGLGNDFADGGLGNDNLVGGAGNDVLLGGMDDDYIDGGDGDDTESGGFGNDILVGGLGADTLAGEEGNDTYAVLDNVLDANDIISDTGGSDTLLLSWLAAANVANLSLVKHGNDLDVKYGGRTLATITDQFTSAGTAIEKIELAGNKFINLSAVSYNAATGVGIFSVAALTGGMAGAVAARATNVQNDTLTKELYFNGSFLDHLSQIAYDEKLGAEIDSEYYNGTGVTSFFRNRGIFGGKYTVYKLDTPGNITGTDAGAGYFIMDAEDQTALVKDTFHMGSTDLGATYDDLFLNAQVIYTSPNPYQIMDVVVNGQVVYTKVANDGTYYAPGATIGGRDIAFRLSHAEATYNTAVAVKEIGNDMLVGAYWNETLDGKSGDDILISNSGDDTLLGGAGNDYLLAGEGNDNAQGGDGADIIFGNGGNDTLAGGNDDDAMLGAEGNDIINGDAGNDWLDGGTGADTINGGDGNDVVRGGEGNDTITGGAGNDVLHGDAGDDDIFGSDGDDFIYGGGGRDVLDGGAGNDILDGAGGSSSLNGGDGLDRITFRSATTGMTLNLATIVAAGIANGDRIISIEGVEGTNYNDTITGFAAQASILYGLGGNDTITGSTANDVIDGGAGNDILNGSNGDDTIEGGSGSDQINGGNGSDTVSYSTENGGVNVYLDLGYGNSNATGDTYVGIENITGSNYNDNLRGSALANVINGGKGNDNIDAYAGNDIIYGGDGGDGINAGAGNDVVYGGTGADALEGLDGNDTIYGEDENDNIWGGVGDDVLSGGAGNDNIEGGDGNDVLDGGTGADQLDGSAGTDTVTYANSSAGVTINLFTNANSGGAAQGDMLGNIENITGSAYNDMLAGSATANTIDGGNGIDTALYTNSAAGVNVNLSLTTAQTGGFAAGDILRNIENVIGSVYNDVLVGNANANIMDGGAGNDQINGGAGSDTVTYSSAGAGGVSVYLAGGASIYVAGNAVGDVLTNIENLVGSNFNDDLRGDDSANVLSGGTGDDILEGGKGNDELWAGDGNDILRGGVGDDVLVGGAGADSITGGDGRDTASYWDATSAVTIYMDGRTNAGGEAQGDTLFTVEVVLGSAYDDTVTGSALNDWIYGNRGYDILYGGNGDDTLVGDDTEFAGNDSLYGQAGNDTLEGDAGNDWLDGGDGDDTVYAGKDNDTVLGGIGIDKLYGDDGNDTLNGGDGNDTIYGGTGADTISGDNGDDKLYGDFGNDTINGNAGIDEIFGSEGNDIIDGGDGNDVLAGENGDDIIRGGLGADVIYTDGPGYNGNDTAFGGDGDDLIKTGVGNDQVNGDAGNDRIYGEAGDDTLSGDAGNDFINAGEGNDVVSGGLGNDTILGYEGNDTLQGNDGTDLLYGLSGDDTIRGGMGNDTIYGDIGTDTLYGDIGDDTLDGWKGADLLEGGTGNDVLSGGDDNDTLNGGDGDDILYGDRQPNPNALPASQAAILAKITNAPSYHSWGLVYQGNQYTVEGLKAAAHEMLILNPAKYSLTNTPNSEVLWSHADVGEIQQSGKVVMGYVNLAKVNSFTNMWNAGWTTTGLANGDLSTAAPTWLSKAESATTREVDFTQSGWQQAVFNRVGQMIEQGFNGTLLDDVLQYYFAAPTTLTGAAFEQAVAQKATAMRDFIIAIRQFSDTKTQQVYGAEAAQHHFQLVVNGAPYLLQDAIISPNILTSQKNVDYLHAIDAIVVENYFSRHTDLYINDTMTFFGANGVTMLSLDTDQVTQQQRIQIITDAVNKGFMPFTTENDSYDVLNSTFLHELNDTPVAGNDMLNGGAGNDTLIGGLGNDTLTGGAGADVFFINKEINANDTITDFSVVDGDKINLQNFAAAPTFATLSKVQSGADTIITLETHIITLKNVMAATLTAAHFIGLSAAITGTAGKDVLTGTGNADVMYGLDGADTISGMAGDDILDGGAGADKIDGGAGVDTLSYAASNAAVSVNLAATTAQAGGHAAGDMLSNIENIIGSAYNDTLAGGIAANVIDAGAGVDTVSYAASSAGVNVNLALATAQSGGNAQGDVLSNIENVTGSALNDVLAGNAANNSLFGGAGDDVLFADAGADKIDGGGGMDTVYYDYSTAAIIVNLAVTTAQSGGFAAGDTLFSIENINGSAYDDSITGSSANNVIVGGAGADTINGGAGSDTAYYAYSAAAVNINLNLATAQSGGDARGDILSNIENVMGSAYNDVLTGNAAANILNGLAGDDTINAGGGDDLIIGGLGSDSIDGGAGIDTISYVSSTDFVSADLGANNFWNGDARWDSVFNVENIIGSNFNDTLKGNAGANQLAGGVGNDAIYGQAGNDTLDGGTGDDQLLGGDGDDILIGGLGSDSIDGGAGIDTISYVSSTDFVSADLGANNFWNGDARWDSVFNVENIIGSNFNDTLKGNDGANRLTGGKGNDTLTGGLGADKFQYAATADSATGTGLRDIITDFSHAQGDLIDLSAFAGTFTFKGTAAFSGTAPQLNYTQIGSSTVIGVDANGDNTLDFQIELAGLHALVAADFAL